MAAIRRILVAIKDPTARTLPAVTKATQIATAFNSRMELFHAITNTLYMDLPGGRAPDPVIGAATSGHETRSTAGKVACGTVRYLGIEVDDALEIAGQTEV